MWYFLSGLVIGVLIGAFFSSRYLLFILGPFAAAFSNRKYF